MPSGASRLLVLVMLVAPPAAHFALVLHRGVALAALLIVVQAVLVAWVASSTLTNTALRVGACGVVFVLALVLALSAGDGPLVAAAVPHAMAYLALLAIFSASLQAGREAVITVLARRSRGHLPADVVRYTRRVTWAWCWFFLAQLLASLSLLLFASPEIWSLFINVCNLPLIGIMFTAEYLYRQRYHAARPPERLVDMLRIFREVRGVPISEDR